MSNTIRWAWRKNNPEATLEDVQSCVGKGWSELIEQAYTVLAEQEDPLLFQVKEKFGGLRFYHMPDCPEIREIEDRSFTVCERCGGTGEPRPGSWTKTLCDNCYEN